MVPSASPTKLATAIGVRSGSSRATMVPLAVRISAYNPSGRLGGSCAEEQSAITIAKAMASLVQKGIALCYNLLLFCLLWADLVGPIENRSWQPWRKHSCLPRRDSSRRFSGAYRVCPARIVTRAPEKVSTKCRDGKPECLRHVVFRRY